MEASPAAATAAARHHGALHRASAPPPPAALPRREIDAALGQFGRARGRPRRRWRQQWGGRAAAAAASLAGLARLAGAAPRGGRAPAARRPGGPRVALAAAPAAESGQQVVTKEKQDVDAESEAETSKDFWAVLVHAEMGSCNMPFCAIPGISGIVCHCKKNGIQPPSDGGNKSLKTRDGKCALSMMEYAEVIAEGCPVLSRGQAYKASAELFSSAADNPVGTTMVIGTFQKAADEYRERLEGLGLWVSVVPVDRE